MFGQSVTFTATVTAPASTTATAVYGQGGDFTTGTVNNGGISATSLWGPHNTVEDSAGNLYVADESNSRVLYYPKGSTTATAVYGQGGDFTTGGNAQNATTLAFPHGLAIDGGGNLYVADSGNNRVLFYPAGTGCTAPNTPSGCGTATKVWGQAGLFTTNTGATTAATFDYPLGVGVDSSGDLYVDEEDNNRVTFFPPGSGCTAPATPVGCGVATQVYGQGGSFTTQTVNKGGISASSFDRTQGLGLDGGGNLYVADAYNNRVLFFAAKSGCTAPSIPSGCATATRVYGQGGSFTTGTVNNGGISANSLRHPASVAIDRNNGVYVTDGQNNRALFFPPGSTTASAVYGQAGNFTTATSGTTATRLSYPHGLSVDNSGNVYIADHDNNRVLLFAKAAIAGTVTFKDGSTALATATLSANAVATFTTSSLAVGTHPMTAVYNGGAPYAGSTSAVLDQVVTAVAVPVPPTGAGGRSLGIALGGLSALLGLMAVLVGVRRRAPLAR